MFSKELEEVNQATLADGVLTNKCVNRYSHFCDIDLGYGYGNQIGKSKGRVKSKCLERTNVCCHGDFKLMLCTFWC